MMERPRGEKNKHKNSPNFYLQVLVEMENRESIDLTQTMEGITNVNKKRKKVIINY